MKRILNILLNNKYPGEWKNVVRGSSFIFSYHSMQQYDNMNAFDVVFSDNYYWLISVNLVRNILCKYQG